MRGADQVGFGQGQRMGDEEAALAQQRRHQRLQLRHGRARGAPDDAEAANGVP
jgi:hypothetical protein